MVGREDQLAGRKGKGGGGGEHQQRNVGWLIPSHLGLHFASAAGSQLSSAL